MGKYRKKPVEVEAFKWTGCINQVEDPQWIVDAIERKEITFTDHRFGVVSMAIKTLEGIMIASPGDYIIKGIQGEIYPCKPDIFEATYEKVGD